MKLRNKKTGEIITKIDVSQDKESIWVLENEPRIYRSLTELNEEWEDYEPKEALIKDDKVRNAVRAWAETCFNDTHFMVYDLKYISFKLKANRSDATIAFYVDEPDYIEYLISGESYTIAELCGEDK